MKEMLQVPLDEVSKGAELAVDVLDARGRVLITAGTLTNDANLAALRRHNIQVLSVWADQDLNDAELELRRAGIAREVEARFARHGDDDLMQRLKAMIMAYRIESLR